ncbi:hypothetical protein A3Q56_00190 [Intoshia linei]|uniref:FHA domain-containing protein n=1 Tax=Intoshia linei TaxID=1819745 RepID=A0A177BCU5_9BILA|nr:hypothetical protein A3Q56_00190 [Intoshia linei]
MKNIIKLSSKLTIIGRSGCDVNINCEEIENQHILIEYSEAEVAYIIHDLNTRQGTYVNDTRVQNSSVVLRHNDIIRLGYLSELYAFKFQLSDQQDYVNNTRPKSAKFSSTNVVKTSCATLELIDNTKNNAQYPSMMKNHYIQKPNPKKNVTFGRTVTPICSRPQSAWSSFEVEKEEIEDAQVESNNSSESDNNENLIERLASQRNNDGNDQHSPQNDIIKILRKQISKLQNVVQQYESKLISQAQSRQETKNMDPLSMKQKLAFKCIEVASLKEQLQNMKENEYFDIYREKSQEKLSNSCNNQENNSAKMKELENSNKEKNYYKSLINDLQNCLIKKDETIKGLYQEISIFREQLQENSFQLKSMQNNFHQIESERRDEIDNKNNFSELLTVKQKINHMQNLLEEKNDAHMQLKENYIEKINIIKESELKIENLIVQSDEKQIKIQELDKIILDMKVDNKLISHQLVRMRNRVTEIVFSTPGINASSSKNMNDDQLFEFLKTIISDRTHINKKISDLKSKNESLKRDTQSNRNNLDVLNSKINKSLNILTCHNWINSQKIKNFLNDITCLDTTEWTEWIIKSFQHVSNFFLNIVQSIEEKFLKYNIKSCDIIHLGIDNYIENMLENINRIHKENSLIDGKLKQLKTKQFEQFKNKIESQRIIYQDRYNDGLNTLKMQMEKQFEIKFKCIQNDKHTEMENLRIQFKVDIDKKNELIDRAFSDKLKVIKTLAKASRSTYKYYSYLKKDLQSLQSVYAELIEKSSKNSIIVENLKQEIMDMESKYRESVSEHVKTQNSYDLDVKIIQDNHSSEQDAIKNEMKDQSEIIAVLEEQLKIIQEKNHCKDFVIRDLNLEISKIKEDMKNTQLQYIPGVQSQKHVPSIEDVNEQICSDKIDEIDNIINLNQPNEDFLAIEQALTETKQDNMTLKRDLTQLNRILIQKEKQVEYLNFNLKKQLSKFTDVKAELSQQEKEDNEKYKKEFESVVIQLDDLRIKNFNLEKNYQSEKYNFDDMAKNLTDSKIEIKNLEEILLNNRKKISNLTKENESYKYNLESHIVQIENLKQNLELIKKKNIDCTLARHENIIQNQKNGIVEMRKRLKKLEFLKNPMPTHEEAILEVKMLRREVSKLKSNDMLPKLPLASIEPLNKNIKNSMAVNGKLNDGQNKKENEKINLNFEPKKYYNYDYSGNNEKLKNNTLMDNKFEMLTKQLAALLEIDSTMLVSHQMNMNVDKDLISSKLTNLCKMITSSVQTMIDSIRSKTKLLEGYESHLILLNQTKLLAQKRENEIEILAVIY